MDVTAYAYDDVADIDEGTTSSKVRTHIARVCAHGILLLYIQHRAVFVSPILFVRSKGLPFFMPTVWNILTVSLL